MAEKTNPEKEIELALQMVATACKVLEPHKGPLARLLRRRTANNRRQRINIAIASAGLVFLQNAGTAIANAEKEAKAAETAEETANT
jgi:hypothetical protein